MRAGFRSRLFTAYVAIASGRTRRRLFALLTAVLVWTASVRPAFAAPDDKRVESLFVQGQEQADDGRHAAAATSWTKLLELLPESESNRAMRESLIISILDQYIKAYNAGLDDSGVKDTDILEAGKIVLDRYREDYASTHGNRQPSGAFKDKATALEQALAKARATEVPPPRPDPPPAAGDDPGKPAPLVVPPQRDGTGLIAGGIVLGTVAVASLAVMMPIGLIRGQNKLDEYNAARDREQAAPEGSDERAEARLDKQRAEFDGDQADQIAIAGAVVGGVLAAGSAAMLVIGIRWRKRSNREKLGGAAQTRVVPSLGRGYAGLGLSGHF